MCSSSNLTARDRNLTGTILVMHFNWFECVKTCRNSRLIIQLCEPVSAQCPSLVPYPCFTQGVEGWQECVSLCQRKRKRKIDNQRGRERYAEGSER